MSNSTETSVRGKLSREQFLYIAPGCGKNEHQRITKFADEIKRNPSGGTAEKGIP